MYCMIVPATGNNHRHRTACYVVATVASNSLCHELATTCNSLWFKCMSPVFCSPAASELLTTVQLVVLTLCMLQRTAMKMCSSTANRP